MSKPIERYRQADVNFWGMLAIVSCGVAVAATSLPSLLPGQVFTSLHASRLNGASVNSLRAEMASLEQENAQLRTDTTQLITRLGLAERDRGAITRRVGALESTVPVLLERIPPGNAIDASIVTSSTGTSPEATPIDGGSIEISRMPLYPDQTQPGAPETESSVAPMPAETQDGAQDMPVLRTDDSGLERFSSEEYGIAVGGTVTVNEAYVSWIDLRNKVGALLIGMEPILSGGNSGYHIVAGPVDRIARAEELCGYVERAGLQCLPVPYSGYMMPQ